MKKIIILISILILGSIVFIGCTDINVPDISDDLTKKMAILTFSVTPSIIELGGTANLSWVVTGSDTIINIDNGIGEVSLTGNRIISPTDTTTYKLTATNGSSTKNVTTQIIVITNTPEENNSESTPDISFMKSSNSLTVVRVDYGIKWDDFTITGECDKSALSDNVLAGDTITDCSGTITIIYNPTNTLIGSWTFINKETQTPDITFNKEVSPTKGLRVVRVDSGIKWDDVVITGGTKPMLSTVAISTGQFIALNITSSNIIIVYTPTNTLIGNWTWG